MKIAILTQPPKMGQNYGCILQAYALQKKLHELGYYGEIIDLRPSFKKKSVIYKLLSVIVRLFKRNILNIKSYPKPFAQWDYTEQINNIICKNTLEFVNQYIMTTKQIEPKLNVRLNKLNQWFAIPLLNANNVDVEKKVFLLDDNEIIKQYDAFIVGSDQVWRPRNNTCLIHYFLDFVCDKKVKRIAYAASFGVAENEYSEELLNVCRTLAQKFDAISVREDSGVWLCKELFDVDAIHVIDPTMFFDTEYYINISKERTDYHNDGDCFTYILDKNDEKLRIINLVSQKFGLKPFNVMPKSKFADVGPMHINDCIMPSVEQWLDGFNKAKFVITDSFHGCVFSIIFKKPFIAIGNASRGMARFDSLLRMFKLENRLIHSVNDLTEELINNEIDYDAVHEILAREREKAFTFLKDALEKEKIWKRK